MKRFAMMAQWEMDRLPDWLEHVNHRDWPLFLTTPIADYTFVEMEHQFGSYWNVFYSQERMSHLHT